MKRSFIIAFVTMLRLFMFFSIISAKAQKNKEYVDPMEGVRTYLLAHRTEPLSQAHCDVIVESTRLRLEGNTARLKRDDRKFRHSKKQQKEETDLHLEFIRELKELCISAIPSGVKVFIFCRNAEKRIPNIGC